MFVQSLMLSMLCNEALDLNASEESLVKSDNVNKGQQQQQEDAEAEAQAETLLNNNADAEQQQQQPQPVMVRQVNQMQQTSPEDLPRELISFLISFFKLKSYKLFGYSAQLHL